MEEQLLATSPPGQVSASPQLRREIWASASRPPVEYLPGPLSRLVNIEEFASLCATAWSAGSSVATQAQREPDARNGREVFLAEELPRVLFKCVSAFEESDTSVMEEVECLRNLGVWHRPPVKPKEEALAEEKPELFQPSPLEDETTTHSGPPRVRTPPTLSVAVSCPACLEASSPPLCCLSRSSFQLPLRRLLGYLCLHNSPSKALLHALAFLAEEPLAQSTAIESCQSQENQNVTVSSAPTEDASRLSSGGACFGVSIQRLEELFPRGSVAPLAEVYAVCVGVGFRRPWKGASPAAQISFLEFVESATSQNLLVPEAAALLGDAAVSAQTAEEEALSATRSEASASGGCGRLLLRLDLFVESALFTSMLASATSVYARGVVVERKTA